MTSTVEALQNIYVSMGGELTDTYEDIANGAAVADYVVIPDVCNAISKIAPDSEGREGSGLPTVTASDNGKVLMVVDGEWAVAAVPTELPTVTADDNGDVLKVVEGAWAKASS